MSFLMILVKENKTYLLSQRQRDLIIFLISKNYLKLKPESRQKYVLKYFIGPFWATGARDCTFLLKPM